jgi:CHAD domain-containing protein
MELDYVKLKDIKPALAECLNESQVLLKRSAPPDEEAVHDIRVLMKKARATARLLSSQIDDELFIKENIAYREIGKLMASSRETSVQRRTLKLLKKENRDLFKRLSENEKVQQLLRKPEQEPVADEDEKLRVEKIIELLNKAAYRLRFYTLDKLNPQMLLKELEKSYIVAADNYLKCRINPKPTDLHEFRKRSKDFLYQLYYFRSLNPSVTKDLEKKLDSLTQNLGKYNDLSQIIRLLDYNPAAPVNSPAIDELIVVIRDKQDEYLSEVWPLGYKIFCPGQNLINVLGFRLLVI